MKKIQIIDELWEILCGFFSNDSKIKTHKKTVQTHIKKLLNNQHILEQQNNSEDDVQIAEEVIDTIKPEVEETLDNLNIESLEIGRKSFEPNKEEKKQNRLKDIRKFASWGGKEGKSKLNPLVELFKEEFPDNQSELEFAIAEGKKDFELFDKAYKIGIQGKSKKEITGFIKTLPPNTPEKVKQKIHDKYKKGHLASQRWAVENKKKKNGQKLSNVKVRKSNFMPTKLSSNLKQPHRNIINSKETALHPNDIRTLHPCSKWTLVIDETGDTFDESAIKVPKRRLGRFVGVLIPESKKTLPPLHKHWHAVNCTDTAEIDNVMQSILNAPVGVFGIDVNYLPMTPGERWMDGVTLLIDWILRLMPIDELCKLNVKIEQRGSFEAGLSWDLVRRDCLRRLALAYPHKAVKIDLKIDTITKDGSPFNGYVDAVAFTWAQTTDSSKERLKYSELEGTCLLRSASDNDSRAMLNAWDTFTQGVNLPTELWWNIICSPDANNPAALINAFLKLVGDEAKANPELWKSFLNETKKRMANSPVNLDNLAKAVDWLQLHQPSQTKILPTLRMVWLTVKLANANHLGKAEQTWQKELKHLGDYLKDEVAPLVCHADLHRAVATTNRFDFDGIKRSLNRWENRPPAEPGLLYWGQIRSSLGQHAAFLGDNSQAIKFFKEALTAFSRLTDPEIRKINKSQTGCYLAIAMIDDPTIENEEVRIAIEKITGTLADATVKIATNSERYTHYLLLRWLVYRKGNEDIRKTYLDNCGKWQTGKGHPWPLIQLYRGILLHEIDPDKALKLATEGAEIAFEQNQGPTVRFIGACCYIIAVSWGGEWKNAEKELTKLEKEIPLAADRIAKLRAAFIKPIPPSKLLISVLPFNFK